MRTQNVRIHLAQIVALLALAAFTEGCATSKNQILGLERGNNIPKLSEIARQKAASPFIRRKALESLAQLKWKPSNEERLEVYGHFASSNAQAEAAIEIQKLSADRFNVIDIIIVDCCLLQNNDGSGSNSPQKESLVNSLLGSNKIAVTMSICQQFLSHPELESRIPPLAKQLEIRNVDDALISVLSEYGDLFMAENFIRCGSARLAQGATQWKATHEGGGYQGNAQRSGVKDLFLKVRGRWFHM